MDPNVATRQQFTDHLCNRRIPSNATEDWKNKSLQLQSLLRKLAYHDAMRPNLQQTYMTPAASKNRVYFMWDFVGRTLGMLSQVPADIIFERLSRRDKEAWADVMSRTHMAAGLIIDDKPGMLNMMIESTNPEEAGRHPDFGPEILEEARTIFQSIGSSAGNR